MKNAFEYEGLGRIGSSAYLTRSQMEELEALDQEFEEFEWEGEVNRSGKEYIAWVQHSLNQIMGLRLAVDGDMGTQTRSAIRSFQQHSSITADGKLGLQTEQYLGQALNKMIASNPNAFCSAVRQPEVVDRFDFDRSEIKAAHIPQIVRVVQCIVASEKTATPIRSLQLVGHTDRVGTTDYNLGLGRRRAEQVKRSLQENLDRLSPGLSSRVTIDTQTRGEEDLIQNDAVRSRRVQIFLIRIPTPAQQSIEKQLEEVLNYIRSEARQAAQRRLSVKPSSNFARVIRSRYLAKYLASPSSATATAAISVISRQNTSGRVNMACGSPDYWERGTPGWNGIRIPDLIRRIPGLGWLPAHFGAATEILTVTNRRSLPYIDVPFLLGRRTFDELNCHTKVAAGQDPDFMPNNSINTSQLMHWATGVRYAYLGRDRLRELFLAYELWHLEHWDVFGQDPINDMIAEDAARHMAEEIRALRLKSHNYLETLNQGFRQARAWVGSVLRRRRARLEWQIKTDPPPSTFEHWQEEEPPTSPYHPYRSPSVRRMLSNGTSIANVKASPLVKRYIEVYTLIFEAENWERTYGPIPLTLLQKKMADGALNSVFRAISAIERGAPTIMGLKRS